MARAAAAGVMHVVCVATTATDSARCVEIASRFPTVWASVGIQPNIVAESTPGDWDEVVSLAAAATGQRCPRRNGLGPPLGLYARFRNRSDYFAHHLVLARRVKLPVIIHCREAEGDVVRMLGDDFDRHGPVRGVMHSFTGDWPTAEACLAMGLFISFAGMVTFKNAADLRAVAAKVPADRLLVETDSPYLAPQYRCEASTARTGSRCPHGGDARRPPGVFHPKNWRRQKRRETPCSYFPFRI